MGLSLDAIGGEDRVERGGEFAVPAAWHHGEQYGNNLIEADHGQLKRRLRPMRHLRNDRTARAIIAGHAFIQNLRRGHYHLTTGVPANLRLAVAFDELRQRSDREPPGLHDRARPPVA